MTIRKLCLGGAMILGVVALAGCQRQANTESVVQEAVEQAAEPSGAPEKKDVTIYLVRHGKTFFNTTGQVQGWADSPLTEEGESQADAAGKGMKDIVFTTAFSGDLGRQRATAKHILAQNQGDIPELQEVIGLREEFYGGFEGKPDEELWRPIYEANGASYDEKGSTYLELSKKEKVDTIAAIDPLHMAETYDDISKRSIEVMDTIVKATQEAGGGNALAVSSGDEIATILDLLVPEQYQGERIANCSVTVLTYKDGLYELKACGDVSYMQAGEESNK